MRWTQHAVYYHCQAVLLCPGCYTSCWLISNACSASWQLGESRRAPSNNGTFLATCPPPSSCPLRTSSHDTASTSTWSRPRHNVSGGSAHLQHVVVLMHGASHFRGLLRGTARGLAARVGRRAVVVAHAVWLHVLLPAWRLRRWHFYKLAVEARLDEAVHIPIADVVPHL